MATTKKTTAAETKAAKKNVVKETATKAVKATAAKATKAAGTKTATAKRATKTAVTVNVQFNNKSYTTEDLVKIAKDVWRYDLKKKVSDFKTVELYVKPEEGMAYYRYLFGSEPHLMIGKGDKESFGEVILRMMR